MPLAERAQQLLAVRRTSRCARPPVHHDQFRVESQGLPRNAEVGLDRPEVVGAQQHRRPGACGQVVQDLLGGLHHSEVVDVVQAAAVVHTGVGDDRGAAHVRPLGGGPERVDGHSVRVGALGWTDLLGGLQRVDGGRLLLSLAGAPAAGDPRHQALCRRAGAGNCLGGTVLVGRVLPLPLHRWRRCCRVSVLNRHDPGSTQVGDYPAEPVGL